MLLSFSPLFSVLCIWEPRPLPAPGRPPPPTGRRAARGLGEAPAPSTYLVFTLHGDHTVDADLFSHAVSATERKLRR